jgi:hypothetical protein
LTAPRDSERGRRIDQTINLPKGKYLVKVYVDREGKLAKDENALLGPDDLVGEVEVESNWPAGYGKMTVVSYPAAK